MRCHPVQVREQEHLQGTHRCGGVLQAAFMKRARANSAATLGKFDGEGSSNGGESLYEAGYKY